MTALPEWVKQIQRDYKILEKDGMMSNERVEYQILKALTIALEALNQIVEARTKKEPGMSVQSIPLNRSSLQGIAQDAMRRIEELGKE